MTTPREALLEAQQDYQAALNELEHARRAVLNCEARLERARRAFEDDVESVRRNLPPAVSFIRIDDCVKTN